MKNISTVVLGLLLVNNANAVEVSNVDELFEAMQNGKDIVLKDDITVNGETYRQAVNSKIIDGNGKVIKGGEFGITSRLSGYTSGGYTFGTDYETYDILMGLNYKL